MGGSGCQHPCAREEGTLAPAAAARWNGTVQAAWYRARRELRRRWRATLLLVVLVGLAGGMVMVLVAGARRASTAYDRFREESLASDLDIRRDGPPSELAETAIETIGRLPQVEAMAQTAFPFIVPAGSGLYPYLDFLAVAGVDGEFGTTIDRPRLLEGRLPAPEALDEVAVLDIYARESGVRVGDRIAFDSYAPAQLEPLFTGGNAGPPAGPHVELAVTGVLDAPTFLSESVGSFVPRVVLTPAFLAEYGDDVAVYPGGFSVRLRGGAADVPTVSGVVRQLFGNDPGLELQPAAEVDAKIDSGIEVVVVALGLCALVAGIASAVAIGQALGRHFSEDGPSRRVLAALGMTRRDRLAALLATGAPIAVGGALLAVVFAALGSPLMPVGLARRAEPDPGVSLDGGVLALGFVGVAVVVAALCLVAALPLCRNAPAAGREHATGSLSRPMLALRRTSLPPPATIGVGMTLDPTDGTATSVRAACIAVTIGATGLVAVAVFATSLTSLASSPPRYGAPWDGLVSGFTGGAIAEAREALSDDPDIERLDVLSSGLLRIDGVEMNVYASDSLEGGVAFTLLEGRLPLASGEVALGSSTMRDLGASFGDTVEIEGTEGTMAATVVGKAAFPVVDERSAVGRGGLVVPGDLTQIATSEEVNRDFVVTWSAGVDAPAANRALADATGSEVSAPSLPSEVNNLRAVDALPRALATFFACLAVVAAVHALTTTTRMRRHDLAVLGALGFQRRQLAATVAWQATAIVLVGLVLGVPLGLVLGRLVWASVADGIGVVDDATVPVAAVVIITIAGLVVANVCAAVLARTARRLAPAEVLRTG
jgi:hypothetical protein